MRRDASALNTATSLITMVVTLEICCDSLGTLREITMHHVLAHLFAAQLLKGPNVGVTL